MMDVLHSRPALIERIAPETPPIPVPGSPEEAVGIAASVAYLLSGDHRTLRGAAEVRGRLMELLPGALGRAFLAQDADSLLDVQMALFAIYEISFVNPLSPFAQHENSPWVAEVRCAIETAWMSFEAPLVERELPPEHTLRDPGKLCSWFRDQAARETALDRRVVSYLEHQASIEDFAFFILSDGHLNYRFYDVLALAQLHYSEQVKGELSRHMWDECGEGDAAQAHTAKFTRTLHSMARYMPRIASTLEKIRLNGFGIPVWNDWRPYAGYNAYLCFGMNRRYLFRSLGSLAMPELFDTGRDAALVRGLRRLGFEPKEEFEYYVDHVELDAEHGNTWLAGAIGPIVSAQPRAGVELAWGAALRMESMRRYNAYLAERFNLSAA